MTSKCPPPYLLGMHVCYMVFKVLSKKFCTYIAFIGHILKKILFSFQNHFGCHRVNNPYRTLHQSPSSKVDTIGSKYLWTSSDPKNHDVMDFWLKTRQYKTARHGWNDFASDREQMPCGGISQYFPDRNIYIEDSSKLDCAYTSENCVIPVNPACVMVEEKCFNLPNFILLPQS